MGNGGSETNDRADVTAGQWLEALPFTHVFRTFRLAIHPSKLLFALAAVLICYFGGRVMDRLFGKLVVDSRPAYSSHLPADEIREYLQAETNTKFYRWRDQALQQRDKTVANMLVTFLDEKPSRAKDVVRDKKALDQLAGALDEKRGQALRTLEKRYKQTRRVIEKGKAAEEDRENALTELDQANDFLRVSLWKSSQVASLQVIRKLDATSALRTIVTADPDAKDKANDARQVKRDQEQLLSAVALANAYERADALQGKGIFEASLSYGILMFNSAVDSVLNAELFRNDKFAGFALDQQAPPGLARTLWLAARGLGWFVRVHCVFFTVYTLFCLAVWAVAGGAICRIAALHATRDEKIPWKEAFGFGKEKFGSFVIAPLMPVVFFAGCCAFLWLAGLVGALPYVGELVVGLLFVLVLAVGFVLALVVVGAIGGLGLMYPTIAVEGSDAFDAFSRSYNYVYARPWRTVFYTLVTAIYGTLCFGFVKFFVWLVFWAGSTITGMTMNLDTSSLAGSLGKLQAIWHAPSLSGPFFGRFFLSPLGWTEKVGGFFIAVWVFILVGLVIAFAISFFFSGSTVIYLLLRRRVDATDMEEVFVEEFEAEPPIPAPAAEPAPQDEQPREPPEETKPPEPS